MTSGRPTGQVPAANGHKCSVLRVCAVPAPNRAGTPGSAALLPRSHNPLLKGSTLLLKEVLPCFILF